MASKKDLRRPDLGTFALRGECIPRWRPIANTALVRITVIPYQEPLAKSEGADVSSTLSQTLPMAAIFTRNRYIGWYAAPRPSSSSPRTGPRLTPRIASRRFVDAYEDAATTSQMGI